MTEVGRGRDRLTLFHKTNSNRLVQLDGHLWIDRRSCDLSASVVVRVELGRLQVVYKIVEELRGSHLFKELADEAKGALVGQFGHLPLAHRDEHLTGHLDFRVSRLLQENEDVCK